VGIKEIFKFLYKKIITVLLPFATMGFLLWTIRHIGVEYWYLRTLFGLSVLFLPFYILSVKINNLIIDLLLFGSGWGLIIICKHLLNTELGDIFAIFRLVTYYPYFAFGLLLRKYKIIQSILNKNITYSISLFLFFLLFFNDFFGFVSISGYPRIIINLFFSFPAIFSLYYLFKECLARNKYFDVFCLLGEHSLEIYLFHFFFAFRLTDFGDYLLGIKDYGASIVIQVVYSAIITIIVIFLSLGIAKIINYSKILSFLFLGKFSWDKKEREYDKVIQKS
jgi:hypothetical protein